MVQHVVTAEKKDHKIAVFLKQWFIEQIITLSYVKKSVNTAPTGYNLLVKKSQLSDAGI